MKRPLITESHVRRAARESGRLSIPRDAIFTPSAKDALRELKVAVDHPHELLFMCNRFSYDCYVV